MAQSEADSENETLYHAVGYDTIEGNAHETTIHDRTDEGMDDEAAAMLLSPNGFPDRMDAIVVQRDPIGLGETASFETADEFFEFIESHNADRFILGRWVSDGMGSKRLGTVITANVDGHDDRKGVKAMFEPEGGSVVGGLDVRRATVTPIVEGEA